MKSPFWGWVFLGLDSQSVLKRLRYGDFMRLLKNNPLSKQNKKAKFQNKTISNLFNRKTKIGMVEVMKNFMKVLYRCYLSFTFYISRIMN